MKDSGIEWIGEIPQGWEVRKLKNLTSLRIEKLIGQNEFMYVGLEHIEPQTGKTISGYEPIYNFPGDTLKFFEKDVLFGKLRPYLSKVMACSTSGKCSSEFFVINPKDIYFKYLFYIAISKGFIDTVNGSTFGVKMPRAEWEFVSKISLPVPKTIEQQQIAEHLDKKCAEIDSVIKSKEKTNELLKEERQSIIYEAVTKGLNPNVPMKDSGIEWIGEIPQGWEVKKLKFLAEICNGQDYKKVQIEEGGFPVMGSGGEFARATENMYDKPSVLLWRKGTIDKPLYVDFPFWTVDTMYYTKINDLVNPKFFYFLCTNIEFKMYQYGSALPSMTQRDLNEIYFSIPEFEEQLHIVNYIEQKCSEIDKVITANNSIIERLKEYRQSTIYEAVTGKTELK